MTDKQVTLGCDPEFFVGPRRSEAEERERLARLTASPTHRVVEKYKEHKEEEEIVPICGMIGGTKVAPRQLEGLQDGFAVQEDGIACEFNIPPQTDPGAFSLAVSMAMQEITRELKTRGLRPVGARSTKMRPEWVVKWPNLAQIGCDPDFIAYDSESPQARVADLGKIGEIRGVGGHLHVGYPVGFCPPNIMAKFMDIAIALPVVDEDIQGGRRAWWGQAGLYRPKSYGIEYRTLSNFWIWNGGGAKLVAGHAIAMVRGLMRSMVQWQALYNATNWDSVRDIIYREDAKAAAKMFERLKEYKCYSDMLKHASDMVFGGSKQIV